MNLRLLTLLLLTATAAHADQAQVIGMEEAEYATAMLEPGTEVRHFCAPCGDKAWRAEVVGVVETTPFEGEEGRVELKINGDAVDCAYVYFQQSGTWRNLAMFLGLEVTGVPAELSKEMAVVGEDPFNEVDAGDIPSSAGFARTHFRGGIEGKKNMLAEMASDGNKISGTYRYTHVQQPLAVYGAAEEEGGGFLLKEFAEGKKTGDWRVSVKRGPLAVEGQWVSPDESKQFPLLMRAYAAAGMAVHSFEANGVGMKVSLEYPVFLVGGHPHAKAINKSLREMLDGIVSGQRDVIEDSAAEDLADTFAGDAKSQLAGWVYDLQDYHIVHCSDSFVSMHFLHYEFAGGAHGNSGTIARNMAIGSDGKIREAAITEFLTKGEDSVTAVSAMLVEELKKQQASNVVDGSITGFTKEELPGFTASGKGLTFYFDPYAVASYAEGPFVVELSWAALGEHGKKALVE